MKLVIVMRIVMIQWDIDALPTEDCREELNLAVFQRFRVWTASELGEI
jgi:hypothetical protein